MRRISLALALIGAVAATGCGQASKPANTGGNRGIESQTFKLTVRGEKRYQTGSGATLRVYMLPEGGLITGAPFDGLAGQRGSRDYGPLAGTGAVSGSSGSVDSGGGPASRAGAAPRSKSMFRSESGST